MTSLRTAPVAVPAARSQTAPWLFGAALTVTVLAFASTWWSFPGTWLQNRTHGFVIAPLCAFLLWRERARLSVSGEPVRPALLAVAALSLGWMLATVISARVVHQAAVPLLLMAWLLAVRGVGSARLAAPAAGTFVLALPVWEVLTWPLQFMTVTVSGAALKLLGLPAEIKGEIITIPSGSLHVAGSCSGLGYLMTALTISSVYSLVYVKQWRTRWRIIGAAAALSLLANWIRVFGLAVIAHNTQMQSSLMTDHEAYGWWIFAATMALFFALLPRLERGDSTAPAAPAPATMAADAPPTPTSATILSATAAALVGPVLLLLVSALPVSGDPSAAIPGIRPGAVWTTAEPAPVSELWVPGFRGASEHRTLFVRRDSVTVRVDRFLYRQQAQGAEMIGSENAVAPDSLLIEERVVGPLDADARSVRQAAVRDGQQLRMVWYWYRVFDVETPSRAKAKLLEIPAFFSRHGLSEVITLSVPCNGRDCGNATRSLYHLATGRELPAASAP